jgi:hypothetical protein
MNLADKIWLAIQSPAVRRRKAIASKATVAPPVIQQRPFPTPNKHEGNDSGDKNSCRLVTQFTTQSEGRIVPGLNADSGRIKVRIRNTDYNVDHIKEPDGSSTIRLVSHFGYHPGCIVDVLE